MVRSLSASISPAQRSPPPEGPAETSPSSRSRVTASSISSTPSGRTPSRRVTGGPTGPRAMRAQSEALRSEASAVQSRAATAATRRASASTAPSVPVRRAARSHSDSAASVGDTSSSAAQPIPASRMSRAAADRSSREPLATIVRSARGTARSRRLTSVMMPKPPKPPISSLARSYPATFFTTRPPVLTTWPSPVTTVSPTTWSRMKPKPSRSGPAVAVASTEPSERSGLPGGSTGNHMPASPRCRLSTSSGAPAWAVATRSSALTETTRLSARVLSASWAGASGPSQVAWPSTRTFHPSAWASCITSATSSVLSGIARGVPSMPAATPESPSRALRRARTPSLIRLLQPAIHGRSSPAAPCRGWLAPADPTPASLGTSRPATSH